MATSLTHFDIRLLSSSLEVSRDLGGEPYSADIEDASDTPEDQPYTKKVFFIDRCVWQNVMHAHRNETAMIYWIV